MPPTTTPPTLSRTTRASSLRAASLTPESFKPFGEVVQNPAQHETRGRLEYTTANQGTATKWIDVSHVENWYTLAPSRKPARAVMNMFVCKPRDLRDKDGEKEFPVKILERHPFTPQTFIPMGVSPNEQDTRYLVIVAPTLKATAREKDDPKNKPYPAENTKPKKSLRERLMGARPNPFTNDYSPTTTPATINLSEDRKPKGPGGPDLMNLQAFIARGDQAVTYGPGTWHAPMVVLGTKDIEFVVVQYANGVGLEDCQEVEVADGITVAIVGDDTAEASAPGIMRAKL